MNLQKDDIPISEEVMKLSKEFDKAAISKDEKLLGELIEIGILLAEQECDFSRAQLFYSIGTAYGDLKTLRKTEDEALTEKQLFYFRKSIELIESCYSDIEGLPKHVMALQQVLYTNYGNSLSACGRKIAAIECYKKVIKINPSFGMAVGNLGLAYYVYAIYEYDPGHIHYLNYFSYHQMNYAIRCKDPNVHNEARLMFQSKVNTFDKEYVEKFLKPDLKISQYTYEDSKELDYRNWCLHNNLFLNTLNDLPIQKLCFAIDVIGLPNMIDTTNGKPVFHGMFNQFKQEYIYARYLYYSALEPVLETHFADKDTYLTNSADYPQYSIRIETVKSSFKILYGLFDKIAFFINKYFNLGIKDEKVTFKRIWAADYQLKDKVYENRDGIVLIKNVPLCALYWINKDFFFKFENSPNPHLKRIYDIRNALVHKYVKVFSNSFVERSDGAIDDVAFYVSENELYELTFELLKIIREAIINLSLCVNVEEIERKRESKGDKAVLPIHIGEYDDEWKV